jgi:hypothetical protein
MYAKYLKVHTNTYKCALMYVLIYANTYKCALMYVLIYANTYKCALMYVLIYANIYTFTEYFVAMNMSPRAAEDRNVCMLNTCMYTQIHTNAHLCICTYTHKYNTYLCYVYIRKYILTEYFVAMKIPPRAVEDRNVCMLNTCIYPQIHTNAHLCICTYTHKYIHTYAMYICVNTYLPNILWP